MKNTGRTYIPLCGLMVFFVFVWLCIVFAGSPPSALAEDRGFTLTVLHTNDVHAHILPFTPSGSSCADNNGASEGGCFGGMARMAAKVNEVRATHDHVILLDAGDQFQGTLFYTRYKEEPARRFMNELRYDAMTLGNHEFDDGPCTAGSFIRRVRFPVLAANIEPSREPCLAGLIKPSVVLDVGAEKVGIIGVTTDEIHSISNPGPNLSLKDSQSAVSAAVRDLKERGVNKIVLLSHAGIMDDQQTAATLDGVDLIVGGHTHTLLSNTVPDSHGPYPMVVRSPNGDPVLLVTASAWGKYLGSIDVTFDEAGVPVAWKGEPILLDAGVPRDPSVAAIVSEMSRPLDALRYQIVGESKVDMSGDTSGCRFEECTLGNLAADALLWATSAQGTQIALQNGGGIRSSIPSGPVSLGQLLEAFPFPNTVSVFELQGKDIRLVLEHGVSRAESRSNSGTGRFLQVAGLRFEWNPSLPVGSRIVDIQVRNPDGTYTPLEDESTYKIATNSFLRRGGDGHEALASRAISACDFGPLQQDATASFLGAHSPVAPVIEGRIVRTDRVEK